MGNLTNLRRDMKWVGEPQNLALPAASALSNPTIKTDAVLNVIHGYMQTDELTFTSSSGNYYGFGTFMQWPRADTTGYRVKGMCTSPAIWGFGWRSGAPGTDVTLGVHRLCGYGNVWDDCLAIRERTAWNEHELVFFGLVPADGAAGVADLAVQCLIGQPDQFSNGVF
jgi:hypothetical protein